MGIFGWLEMVSSTEGCWVMKTERRQLCATIPPSLPFIVSSYESLMDPSVLKKGNWDAFQ